MSSATRRAPAARRCDSLWNSSDQSRQAPCPTTGGRSSRGKMIQSKMYAGTARPPVTTAAATHNSRMSAGSISKYSASPPATPAHIRSRVLRMRRLEPGGGGAYGGYGGGGGDAGGVGGYSAI